VRAEPDFVLWRGVVGQSSVEVTGFVEVKGKWSVPSETNIRAQYESNRYVTGAVNQLFSYLVLNHRKAGILTTYDMTWFFERREENGEEHLYVSDGIPFDSLNPTLFQCLAYFIGNVASDADFKSPPSSRTSSPRQLRKSSSTQEMVRSPLSQSFSVDDLNTGPKLGEGRTGNVFLADSNLTALKTLDVSKRPHLIPEIQNEIAIYSRLTQLQGRVIPSFRYCGLAEGILFVVGLDYSGKVPSRLDQNQKEVLVEGLSEIHSYGILHGDIRLENIVVDSAGHPFIIDFALSSLESNPEKLNEELGRFRALVSSL
jgi:predicted Ser/Thr protein kinase